MKPFPTIGQTTETGFTLIELMIAVAIVAILASVAVIAYIKHIHAGRLVEGKALVALIQSRQEAYFQQYGQYCDAAASGIYPPLIPGKEPVAKPWTPVATSGWVELGVKPESGYTYFALDVRASAPPAHALFGLASSIGIPAQPTSGTAHPWYYVTAEADFDGDNTKYTELRTSSAWSQIIVLNEGE